MEAFGLAGRFGVDPTGATGSVSLDTTAGAALIVAAGGFACCDTDGGCEDFVRSVSSALLDSPRLGAVVIAGGGLATFSMISDLPQAVRFGQDYTS